MSTAAPNVRATLCFQETEFEVIDLHGQTWLRGIQIGYALGFKNPRTDIAKLFDRNADEFTSEMTQSLDLPTAGGRQQVRLFSLRGAHLLGMLARTAVAAKFRRWVLDVLEGLEVPQQTGRLTLPQALAYIRERRVVVREIGWTKEAGVARELYANLGYLSRRLGIAPQPLEELAPALRQGTLILPGASQ